VAFLTDEVKVEEENFIATLSFGNITPRFLN
jgi:hypothetical protein